MTCAVCPNCGTDMARFEPVKRGDLEMSTHEVRWKDMAVKLRPSGRLLVSALVRAHGTTITLPGISEAIGCDQDAANPLVVARMQVCHARQAFRQIDPGFEAIRTVRSLGLRWAA